MRASLNVIVNTMICQTRSCAFLFVCWVTAVQADVPAPSLESCLWGDTSKQMAAHLAVRYEQEGSGVWRERSYIRLWRAAQGEMADDVVSASILYGLAPATVHSAGHLRWQFTGDHRESEDWVYVPRLQKVRRATVRDAEDMIFRRVEDDLMPIQPSIASLRNVEVLSDSAAQWRVQAELVDPASWRGTWWVTYEWGEEADAPCRVTALEQRDNKGKRVKGVDYQWRREGQHWFRSMIFITDVPSAQRVRYHFTEVQLNPELKAALFGQQGLRNLPRTMREGGWLVSEEP